MVILEEEGDGGVVDVVLEEVELGRSWEESSPATWWPEGRRRAGGGLGWVSPTRERKEKKKKKGRRKKRKGKRKEKKRKEKERERV